MNIDTGSALLAAISDQWPRIVQSLTDKDVTPFIAILVGLMVLFAFRLVMRKIERKSRLKAREIDLRADRTRKHINNRISGSN